MHHAHAKEIYGQQKEIRAIEYYHQHHYIYWYIKNMNIPFQLKWSKSFSILYDMGHDFLNAAHNFGGQKRGRWGWGVVKEGLLGEFVRLFLSGFAS